MYKLIRNLLGDWQVWILVLAPSLLVMISLIISTSYNNSSTQRQLELANASVIQKIGQVQEDIASLRAEVIEGARERIELKRTIEPLKQEIEKVKETTKQDQ